MRSYDSNKLYKVMTSTCVFFINQVDGLKMQSINDHGVTIKNKTLEKFNPWLARVC